MLVSITPKSAAKHIRRQSQQMAEAQLRKITEHLDGFIEKTETPAQAVKRMRATLEKHIAAEQAETEKAAA